MKEKVYNAIYDENVTFFLFPTAKLRGYLTENRHPYAQAITNDAKAALIEGNVLPVSKQDVLDLINDKLKADRKWLMTTGEIRVAGSVNVQANKLVKGHS